MTIPLPYRIRLTFKSPDCTVDLTIDTERPVPIKEQVEITTQLLRKLCGVDAGETAISVGREP